MNLAPEKNIFLLHKNRQHFLYSPHKLHSLYEAILTDVRYELPITDDKILEIDLDYAKETLNRNLLKRLEIAS